MINRGIRRILMIVKIFGILMVKCRFFRVVYEI
jgi:hypothetical protein